MDLVYCCITVLPLRLVLSGMKEVTRTWKVLSGVTQAHSKYKDSLLVMIAIGWAKGQYGAHRLNEKLLQRLLSAVEYGFNNIERVLHKNPYQPYVCFHPP